ncbi:exotoxin [Labilibacter sediminis]|nr:exotoxin [Labilibacter sediminis]
MKYISIVILFISINSCVFFETSKIPSVPLLYLNFNGDAKTSGIESFKTYGNQKLSYAAGIKDSCLNLSIESFHRKPVILKTKGEFILNQQNYFSVMVWIKMQADDLEEYGIIGNKSIGDNTEKGWVISTTSKGSWKFEISDGFNQWFYKATPSQQKINDGQWHQIGFMVDKNKQVARTFFDGCLSSVLSLDNINNLEGDYNLHIGCNPGSVDYSKDTFNGLIDEVGIWSQQLNDDHFKHAFQHIKQERVSSKPTAKETIKVMTWNIWNGGMQHGKIAGLEQIIKIIKENEAEIIALQEEFGSGEYIADKLGYYFFRRSPNLCVISRYPLGNIYNVYRPLNSGGIEVILNKDHHITIFPTWLSYKPNIQGLLMNSNASTDTIIDIEKDTRGNEATFILSELKQFNSELNKSSVIIAGDFNSGSHLDWTEINKTSHKGHVIPFPATKKMLDQNFKDAYREIWPNEVSHPGYTFSSVFKDGYKDRIDFVFYKGERLKAIDAVVIDSASSFFPSDHAAVLVTFQQE